MKIIAISDLHGYLPEITEEADILLIAGDISPLYIQSNKLKMLEWLKTNFKEWVDNLPVDKIFLVAGNHDFVFESLTHSILLELLRLWKYKVVYLENQLATYIDKEGKEWSIFGTPYCHIFGNWPFMRSDEYLEEEFNKIPTPIDIIITHDPPYNVGFVDATLEIPYPRSIGPKHCGNILLRNRLEKINYKLCVSGHIHSGNHSLTKFNTGECINVSLLNESYEPTYKPFVTELIKD